MAPPRDVNRDAAPPVALFSDNKDNVYDDSEDDDAAGVDFQLIMDEVLGPADPFAGNRDTEEDDMLSGSEENAGDSEQATIKALEYLAQTGLPLSKLLDDVLLGDQSIRSNRQVMSARTELLKLSVIPCALSRTRKPPAGMRLRGKAHSAAKDELEAWALDTSKDILRKELVTYTATIKAPQTETEVVSKESLRDMTFDALVQQIETHTPRLCGLLSSICMATRRDMQRQKDSKFCITMLINALANQISQLNNRMQELLCICFKAKSVPESIYHLFYRCGVVKSYWWSVKALASIFDAAMDKTVQIFE
ncbi:hypothetical protein BDV93DRAFT_556888 [Ceratobasidium sp. AG-I]|nr:hypothetical protein BDV93DRAFT_556888 [Ceratobasidium sp. AG-I]